MATGAGGSWSHLHASGYARVHNGHNFNNNYYFNGSPTQFYAPEDEQTGEKLLKAAREGHTPRVEALLRDRPDLRDYADAKELTALHYASSAAMNTHCGLSGGMELISMLTVDFTARHCVLPPSEDMRTS